MTTHTDTRKPGRGWAYIGAILGGSVSIAANIAHSYIPPTHAAAHWAPEPGSVIGSVFWPIALFVAVEILTRIPGRPAGAGPSSASADCSPSPWSRRSSPTGICPGSWTTTPKTRSPSPSALWPSTDS